MQEIASQFKVELTRLVNMHGYDTKLDMPDYIIANLIYSNLDSLVKAHEANKEWHGGKVLAEPNHTLGTQGYAILAKRNNKPEDKVYKGHCSSQEIAEAGCDGDIRHCKNACSKLNDKAVSVKSYDWKTINDTSDKRLEPILKKLKDLGVIKSWYYNGSYHGC